MSDQCRTKVWRDWHSYQCKRKAVKDGYCKQHHPESVKQREEAAELRYKEKEKETCWYKLKHAHAKITAQAELIRSLQAALKEAEERIAGLLRKG